MSETDEVEEAIQRLARSQDDENLPAGTLVAGRFEVQRILGMGAMGAVYLATQKSMDREVALKTLQHHSMKSEELLRRFYLEAKAASKLDHPNIVRIFDFGIDEDLQLPFIAMEYLTGGDLSDVLLERGPMPEHDACRLLSQVAKALVDAHDKGIVHRDLKPDNIHVRRLTDGDQQCKVLDFGIAKVVQGGSESMANLTGTGMTMGTPLYMSPE
ncbi:MAG: serine/threonine-protein kinase, partial [Myxococcota bacterium]|nr:serine/threonine-protein kinase [Myxococcota bacterium]